MLGRRSTEALLARESSAMRSAALSMRAHVDRVDTLTEAEKRLVRSAAIAAYCRCRPTVYLARILDRAGTLTTTVIVLVIAAATSSLILGLTADGHEPAIVPRYVVLASALCAGAGLANRSVLVRVLRDWREMRAERDYYPFVAGFLLVMAAAAGSPLVILTAGISIPRTRWALLTYAVAAPAFAAGLASSLILVRVFGLIMLASGREGHQQPLDLPVLWLTSLTAQAWGGRTQWSRAAHIRELRQAIEGAAWAIEHDRARLRRTRPGEIRMRRRLRADQRKLAGVLRVHGDALAAMRSPADYERICESLQDGLLAAVARDYRALLANAPELPPTAGLTRIARAAVPPLILAGAAAIVGWLPGVDPKAAVSARVLLLIAAALSAVPGTPGLSDTVRSTVEKALPWQNH